MSDKDARANAIGEYRLKTIYAGALKRSGAEGNKNIPRGLIADIFERAPGASTKAYPLAANEYAVAVAGKLIPAGSGFKKS